MHIQTRQRHNSKVFKNTSSVNCRKVTGQPWQWEVPAKHNKQLKCQISSSFYAHRNIATCDNSQMFKLVCFGLIEAYLRYSTVLWENTTDLYLQCMFEFQKKGHQVYVWPQGQRSLYRGFQTTEYTYRTIFVHFLSGKKRQIDNSIAFYSNA